MIYSSILASTKVSLSKSYKKPHEAFRIAKMTARIDEIDVIGDINYIIPTNGTGSSGAGAAEGALEGGV